MNIRTILLPILLLAGTASALGQTKMIAHRSHSGNTASFTAAGSDNFGEMRMRRIDTVLKLSDTSAVEFSDEGVDTTYHHHFWSNPKVGVDSLRKLFPRINFKGYDRAKKHTSRNRRSVRKAALYPESQADPNDGGGTSTLVLVMALAVPALGCGIYRLEKRRQV